VKYTVKYVSIINEVIQISFMFGDIAYEFQQKLLSMGCVAWVEIEEDELEE
jgi:hypothetical protein